MGTFAGLPLSNAVTWPAERDSVLNESSTLEKISNSDHTTG